MLSVSKMLSFVNSLLTSLQLQMVPNGAGQMTAVAPTISTPTKTDDEPLYVNAKQYNRILKRRAARAKLEADGRIPKERRVNEIDTF